MSLDLEPTVTLPWLVRLRWLFFVGQLLVLGISRETDRDPTLHWWLLIAAVAGYGISNLLLRSARPRRPAVTMGAVLFLDCALLTVMLAASGGPSNPFTVLYLVSIALAALVLGSRWTAAISLLCVVAFGLLFLFPVDHAMHSSSAGFDRHLYRMFAAFVVAAGLTAYFVGKIVSAIAAQHEQIAALREDAARNARLASITTLAAGAAHELGSPLATIAVAAHEANLRVRKLPAHEVVAADLELILLEVDRCQDILQQLAARSSQGDDSRAVSMSEVVEKVRDSLGAALAPRLELRGLEQAPPLRVPVEQLVQSLSGLVRNAVDASDAKPVVVTLTSDPTVVRIAVEDSGSGIPPEFLKRIGEPFFTTKEPGRGLGLGVFLARAFFESCGGGLVLESTVGVGTRVTAHLPRERVT
jgi:two-component system, sensor histidine kinase RegB